MWKEFGPRKIHFDRIFARSYWLWRKHPVLMVPTMLDTGLSTIEQSFATVTLIIIANFLAGQGTLQSVSSSLFQRGYISFLQSSTGLFLIAIFGTAIVAGYVLVGLIGGGFVYSAEYGSYLQAWEKDDVSFSSVLAIGRARWKAMATTIFFTILVTWSPLIIVGLITLLVFSVTHSLIAAIFSFGSVYIFAVVLSFLLSIFTVYSYPAVVVDNVSGIAAIRHSFHVASDNLGATITYGIVRGAFQLLLTLIALQFGGFQVQLPVTSLVTAVLSLLLIPVLHSTKTMIFYRARASAPEMMFNPSGPIASDLYRKLPRAAGRKVRMGILEIGRYLSDPANIPYHALSTVALIIGIVDGNYITNNGLGATIRSQPGYNPYRGNPNVVLPNVIPPALGVDIFLHNWIVSMGTAMAGIGFGLPSLADILFNGFIVGIIQPLTPTNAMFLAAILPHGIIEIPSLVLAGSIGLKLGVAAWKSLSRDAEKKEVLSATLRQAVYVVVGLALLFLIAGLIEADVTPFMMRMYGWTF